FVSCNFVGHFVVFSSLDAGIVIDKVLGIVRWLSIWAVNRNCSKRFTKDVSFAQVVDGFHQGVRQHLNPSERNLVLWSNVEVHVVWLTRLYFALKTIHAGSQCSGKAKVRTASEVRCPVFDSAWSGNAQHLGAVIAAIGNSNCHPGANEFGTGLESLIGVHGWCDHGHVATSVLEDAGRELIAKF